jgi:hypothetical protein
VPRLIPIPTFPDARGCLSVLDGSLPFPIRRVYYIYGAAPGDRRAGHRHRKNRQALICVAGRCDVYVHDGCHGRVFHLDTPDRGLLLEAADWHSIDGFSYDAVLLVLASEPYDVADYIDEPYP